MEFDIPKPFEFYGFLISFLYRVKFIFVLILRMLLPSVGALRLFMKLLVVIDPTDIKCNAMRWDMYTIKKEETLSESRDSPMDGSLYLSSSSIRQS